MRSARFTSALLVLSGLLCLAVAAAESDKPAGSKAPVSATPRAKTPAAPTKKDAGATKPGPAAPKKEAAPAKAAEGEAEAAVHASAKGFAESYNRHDAKALAAGFTENGELMTEDGTVLRGRDVIEQHFQAVFAAAPKARIGIRVEAIRAIGSGVAIEEGLVESASDPEATPERSQYVAVHVQQSGKWLVARARDFPAEAIALPVHERLKDLEFLAGDWLGEGEGVSTNTSCRWVDNGNYLVQEFTIRFAGRVAITGSTRIGWDPQSKQIRSWTFDSDGSFSEARWTGAGHEWMLKSNGTTHDGRSATATTLLKRIDATTLSWESHDRVEGGVVTPGVGPIVVKRRPPSPAE